MIQQPGAAQAQLGAGFGERPSAALRQRASYRRIRIGWVEGARDRPEEFRKRLRYFVAMTAKNKRYGMVR